MVRFESIKDPSQGYDLVYSESKVQKQQDLLKDVLCDSHDAARLRRQ
jgi:hypothetical protein